jgi:hypothetical protein
MRHEDGSYTRSCHGVVCNFAWLEADDYKHFVQSFATAAQYDAARMSEQGLVGVEVKS